MSLALKVNSSQNNKRLELDVWFMTHGIKKKEVADRLDVSPQRFSQILKGDYTSSDVYESLLAMSFGEDGVSIPVELVPRPYVGKKSGPKSKEA
ncbi:hypothetical protein [Maridesulfovibrio sp.]|uniref:hypothetical protein n=1 Tax=Maridesulfovibrio sp. TaxID=2795000 RepID=UPI0029CA6D5C|nr:hypothetical protein [Maridesulfovibrio sp.]